MDGTDYERLMALCGEMDLGAEPEPERPAEEPEEKEPGTRLRIHTERGKAIFDKRRFTSETALMAAADWYWRPGCVYHVLTGGDVDFLTFLRFSCAITSSANINTNPRTENTVITCDRDVALWYKAYYDGIHPFNGSPEGWEPYEVR